MQDTRLFVRVEGQQGTGSPCQAVLLLHGFPDSSSMWSSQVNMLLQLLQMQAGLKALAGP